VVPAGTDAKVPPVAAGAASLARAGAVAGVAAREIEGLRAQLAERDRELARLRAAAPGGVVEGPKDMTRFTDPSPEELLARAQRCQVAFNYPNFDAPEPPRVGDKQSTRLGLSDTERQVVDEAIKDLYARTPAQLRKLYGEMSGDPATAERLSPSAVFAEILQKAPEGLIAQARTQLARERAGLAPAPANLSTTSVVERALRLMVGLGDDFERRIGEKLGPERARSLRPLREGWRNTSSMSGCQSP
jgi:hypothetical protein